MRTGHRIDSAEQPLERARDLRGKEKDGRNANFFLMHAHGSGIISGTLQKFRWSLLCTEVPPPCMSKVCNKRVQPAGGGSVTAINYSLFTAVAWTGPSTLFSKPAGSELAASLSFSKIFCFHCLVCWKYMRIWILAGPLASFVSLCLNLSDLRNGKRTIMRMLWGWLS